MTRDQLAQHLFEIMNKRDRLPYTLESGRPDPKDPTGLKAYWQWMVDSGYHHGYLRLADEILSKGYKP